MRTIGLLVGGMRCRRCVREVTARLRDVPGVATVVADTGSSQVRLGGTMTVDDVLGALRGLTFAVELLNEPGQRQTADHVDADRHQTATGQPPSSGS